MIKAIFTDDVNTISVSGLTQWDYGRKLHISGLNLPDVAQVHFASDNLYAEAVIRLSEKVEDGYIVDIPNQCLREPYDIKAWVYEVDAQHGETKKTVLLPIFKRTRPKDFVNPPDPSEEALLNEWIGKINENIEDNKEFKDDITTQQNNFETKITQEHAKHVTDVNNLVDQRLSSVYRPCGSVATVNDLPTNAKVGDVYDVIESGVNWVWTGDKWDSLAGNIDLTNYYTKAQTDTEIDTAKSEVIDQMKSTVKAYTLLASGWVDNRYTIKDPLITTTSNQKIMLAMDMTDEQLQAYGGAMLSDGGQSNGQMTIIAKGEVPTIDVPIRIMYSYTLLETPRASDKVTLSDRNDTGDSISFGVDGNGNYGYIEQGTQTVKPFATKYELDKEVMTGDVWIDGKPIYMKVIQKSNISIKSSTKIPHGITNLDNVINFNCLFKDAKESLRFLKFPTNASSSDSVMMTVDNVNIGFIGSDSWDAHTNRSFIFTIYYTKKGA